MNHICKRFQVLVLLLRFFSLLFCVLFLAMESQKRSDAKILPQTIQGGFLAKI